MAALYILDVVLILISIVLIVAVLMQQGQRQGLGAIGGGAETFFGKNKARSIDGKLQRITRIAVVVFVILAIIVTILSAHTAVNRGGVVSQIEEAEVVEDAEAAIEETAEDAGAAIEETAEEAEAAVEEVAEEAEAAVEEATEG